MALRAFLAVRRPLSAALSLVTLAAFSGCTNVPLTAPSGTVITLISTANVLPINGAADILAVLVENGTAPQNNGGTATTAILSTGNPVHNGTLVTFTTTLGRMEPSEAKTANGGQVTVKLVADGRSGVATITALSGGASKTLTVNIGAAAAARVLLSAVPQTLPANGGTATVTASVQDQQGNGIAGVPVTFSTTKGALGAATVITDGAGFATTTVTTTADATVTASAGGGGTATLQGTVNLTIASRASMTFTGPAGAVTAGIGTTFIVTIGSTIAASEVTLDFGDGAVAPLGAVSGSSSQAHAYERGGVYTATLTGKFVDGSTLTQTASVVVNDWDFTVSCGGNITFQGGQASTLSATLNPTGVSISDWFWSYSGEGSEHGGQTQQHVWQSRGTKTVTVTATPTVARPAKTRTCQLEVN